MDTRTIEERKVILKRSLSEDNVLYMERLVIWYSVTKEFWPKTIKKPDFTLEVDRQKLKKLAGTFLYKYLLIFLLEFTCKNLYFGVKYTYVVNNIRRKK